MDRETGDVLGVGIGPVPILGPKRAFLVFVSYYAAQIVVGIPIGLVGGMWYVITAGAENPHGAADGLQTIVVWASIACMAVGGVVAFGLARRSLPGPLDSGALLSIGWKRAAPRDLLWSSLAGVGLAVLYIYGLLPAGPPSPDQQWGPLVSAASSGGWARHGWAVLLLLVSPPVEEFVFRGVIFAGFCRSWTYGTAGTLVTVLFVAAHLPEIRFLPALIAVSLVGGAALVARISTHSLGPAIALHASYNLGIVVATYSGVA